MVDETLLYQRLGELTAEMRGVGRQINDLGDELRRHIDKDEKAYAKIDQLEADRDKMVGSIRAIKWLGSTAAAVVAFIGAEKLAVLLGLLNHVG